MDAAGYATNDKYNVDKNKIVKSTKKWNSNYITRDKKKQWSRQKQKYNNEQKHRRAAKTTQLDRTCSSMAANIKTKGLKQKFEYKCWTETSLYTWDTNITSHNWPQHIRVQVSQFTSLINKAIMRGHFYDVVFLFAWKIRKTKL